jgi:hypothetical protein
MFDRVCHRADWLAWLLLCATSCSDERVDPGPAGGAQHSAGGATPCNDPLFSRAGASAADGGPC